MTQGLVTKAWGSEVVVVNTELYCLKKMMLVPGWQCSLHSHTVKDETFLVESGTMELELGPERLTLSAGDVVRIEPGVLHRFKNTGKSMCRFLEVSTHHDDADVTRIEESRRIWG